MNSRRQCIVGSCAIAAAALLPGCAGPLSGIPRFSWGQSVDMRGVLFRFDFARFAAKAEDVPLQQKTSASSRFVLLGVTMTNRTDAALEPQLHPQFVLLDADRRMYEMRGMEVAERSRQPPAGNVLFPPSLLPNRPMEQVWYFEVPAGGRYVLLVVLPSGRALYSGNNSFGSPLNSYFIMDLSTQLG